tara:strand:- start:1046 stop:1297 length:252 start_codon:yes stop_codon:yes gene_type:complete
VWNFLSNFFKILGKKKENSKGFLKERKKEYKMLHFFYFLLLAATTKVMTLLVGTIKIIEEETLSRRTIPCDITTTSPPFFCEI